MSNMTDTTEVEVRRAFFRTNTVTVRGNTTAYSLGDRVMLGTSDLSVYECIAAGTSAGAPPTFNTALGNTTTDGSVTWLTLKQGMPKRPKWIALYTANPGETGGGTEVTGGSYARVNLDPLDANWTGASATNGLTDNASAITFPAPTANWGVVSGLSINDRSAAGIMEFFGALTVSKTVNNGDAAPSFPVNTLSITFQ